MGWIFLAGALGACSGDGGGSETAALAAGGESDRAAGTAGDLDAPAPVTAAELAGEWQADSDDGTQLERVELRAQGDALEGTWSSLERGYFSGRVTVKQRIDLRGSVQSGQAMLHFSDAQGGGEGVDGLAYRRGEYLVFRVGGAEQGFARPGASLVASAEGAAEAQALLQAIDGRVYSMTSQAAGGGVDMGGSVSRRGTWSIVLYAGAPTVRAEWQGTGTSYSLTAYFQIRPSPDGDSALVNGSRLPVTDRC